MSASIWLHPIARERHLLETMTNLRTRNYVVIDQPGARFVRAIPESQVDAQITKKLRAVFPDWRKYL